MNRLMDNERRDITYVFIMLGFLLSSSDASSAIVKLEFCSINESSKLRSSLNIGSERYSISPWALLIMTFICFKISIILFVSLPDNIS